MTMHALHAQPAGIGGGNCGNAHHGAADGGIDLFRQRKNLCAGIVSDCTAADVDVRLLSCQNHLRSLFDLVLLCRSNGSFYYRCLCAVLIERILHVLGNIHQNRTRSAGLCNAECLPNGVCQLFHMLYQEVVLGNGHGYTGDVDLLEAVPSDERVRNVAGNGNQRNRVQISRCDTGDQIGCAGTGGGDDNAYLAGSTCIAVGSVGCALFVSCDDVMDPILCQIESIVDIDDLSARIAEYRCCALFDEGLNNNLCAFQCHLSLHLFIF